MSNDYNADLDGVIKGILAHIANPNHEQTEALNKQVYEKLSKIIDQRVCGVLAEFLKKAGIVAYDKHLNDVFGVKKKETECTPIIPQQVIEQVKKGKKD